MARVRYIVDDVEEAVVFYTSNLGFEIKQNFAPAIAILDYDDLESVVSNLKNNGVNFRNDILDGVGGKQIVCEDPSGNVVELTQPKT